MDRAPADRISLRVWAAIDSPLTIDQAAGDPPVPIGRPLIDQTLNIGRQFRIPGSGLGTSPAIRSMRLERAISKVSAIVFTWYRPEATSATARSVFYPRKLQRLFEDFDLHGFAAEQGPSCRTRSSSLRASDAGTTSSYARIASLPPSLISRLHLKTRLGESPGDGAT